MTYYHGGSGIVGFDYNGTAYYFRKNLQGDVIGIYDSNGSKILSYNNDAWGNVSTILNSPWIKEHCSIANERKNILENSPKCQSCKIKSGCNFGCIGIAKNLGDIMSFDGLCDLRVMTSICYSNRLITMNENAQKTNVVQISKEGINNEKEDYRLL